MSNVLQNTGGNTLKVHGGGVFGSAAAPASAALFTDDFSTGDVSKSNDYFRWYYTAVPTVGTESDKIESVLGPNGVDNVNAFTFTFGTWQELGFSLTKPTDLVRTSREAVSATNYPEVWMSYDMFIPANYTHDPDVVGSSSATNNKGLLYLWGGSYGSTDKQSATSIQHWGSGDHTDTLNRPMGYVHNGDSIQRSADYIHPDHLIPGNQYYPSGEFFEIFTLADQGAWHNYKFKMYAGSVFGASDSITEIYRDNTLLVRYTGQESTWQGADKGRPLGYDRGYILGYANNHFAATTIFRMTNFKFGETEASVA